jgi:hypothetical protein
VKWMIFATGDLAPQPFPADLTTSLAKAQTSWGVECGCSPLKGYPPVDDEIATLAAPVLRGVKAESGLLIHLPIRGGRLVFAGEGAQGYKGWPIVGPVGVHQLGVTVGYFPSVGSEPETNKTVDGELFSINRENGAGDEIDAQFTGLLDNFPFQPDPTDTTSLGKALLALWNQPVQPAQFRLNGKVWYASAKVSTTLSVGILDHGQILEASTPQTISATELAWTARPGVGATGDVTWTVRDNDERDQINARLFGATVKISVASTSIHRRFLVPVAGRNTRIPF